MPSLWTAGMPIDSGSVDGLLANTRLVDAGFGQLAKNLPSAADNFFMMKRAVGDTTETIIGMRRTINNMTNRTTGGTNLPVGGLGLLPGDIESGTNETKKHWYSKFFQKNEEGKTEFSTKGVRALSVTTGIARMIAPFITAAGAAHKDKSTDVVETSKILTGVGNGLSGAAMGAQIGMMAGPWGALVGAIGGFALNGLEAILDGAKHTLAE